MSAAPALPPGCLVGFYSDDFTGGTSVMEALTFAGVPAVMFLDVPTPAAAARFSGARAIGIAGIARSQSPAWMEEHLPPAFAALAGLRPPLVHYKICSTFDSAPHVGSIGRAVEIAERVVGGDWHPLLVAAPINGRYQAFGHLFAALDGVPYRIDRHPVMACHPVTPMTESDVRAHLALQTALPMGLIDLVAMKSGHADARLREAREHGARLVALDAIDDETLVEAGRLIWQERDGPRIVVGSQGIEHALIAYWRAAGLLAEAAAAPRAGRAERMAAVSGSCSLVTGRQIDRAESAGFRPIRVAARRAVDEGAWAAELARVETLCLAALGEGQDPLAFTARGPDDPAIAGMADAIAASGVPAERVNDRIGAGLGRLLDRVMRKARLSRAIIAGGDTSGHAARELGLCALSPLAPISPGAPLCHGHRADPALADIEIALKGGQMGSPDFFRLVRDGGPSA